MSKVISLFDQLCLAVYQFREFLDAPEKVKNHYHLVYGFALFRQARLCNFLFFNYIASLSDCKKEDIDAMSFAEIKKLAIDLGILEIKSYDIEAVLLSVSHAAYYVPERSVENRVALEEQMPMVCSFFEQVVQNEQVGKQAFKKYQHHL